MFEVIPAVDIQGGRAVRLFEGDPERETVYFDDPVEAARHWAGLGAATLHLVDLDAALGRGSNGDKVRAIATALSDASATLSEAAANAPDAYAPASCRLELGGGIRSAESALSWLEVVDRVILGTAAQRNPALVRELIERVGPERVAVSVDARSGKLAVEGWVETTDTEAGDFARQMSELGLEYLIYTDVSRDGTLQGVDSAPLEGLRDAFPHRLIAGGGVGSDADLDLYERLGLDGAIVGRALYEGRITYPRTA